MMHNPNSLSTCCIILYIFLFFPIVFSLQGIMWALRIASKVITDMFRPYDWRWTKDEVDSVRSLKPLRATSAQQYRLSLCMFLYIYISVYIHRRRKRLEETQNSLELLYTVVVCTAHTPTEFEARVFILFSSYSVFFLFLFFRRAIYQSDNRREKEIIMTGLPHQQ